MNKEKLLEYYDRELAYLRKMGAGFAKQFPKVAGLLELDDRECPDPQVERLIESFAFLTSRIQYNIDNDFPQLTTAMLGVLYPQLLSIIPSMAIARFKADPDQGKLTNGHLIKKNTTIFTQTNEGDICRFRTCYPVELWPVSVVEAEFESPQKYAFLDSIPNASMVLKIRLKCDGVMFNEINLNTLRFHLNGNHTLVYKLYELFFAHLKGVCFLEEGSGEPRFLPNESVSPVGFRHMDETLPVAPNSHTGYRLLLEYFTFPDKFLFFDLNNLDHINKGEFVDLIFIFDLFQREGLVVDENTFCLGCSPVINLFNKVAEPVRIDHKSTEYLVIPDAHREKTTEIYSIESVMSSDGRSYEPYFSYNHFSEDHERRTFWTSRSSESLKDGFSGTETRLSFVDLDFNVNNPADQVATVHTICTNRGLAEQIPAGAVFMIEEAAPLSYITLLGKPTAQISPHLGGSSLWKLVSHLSLNHLSLTESQESLKPLKEILKLYNFSNHKSIDQQIFGLKEMSSRKVVRRVGDEAWRGLCRGYEITLTFDEKQYVGSSSILLASVLNYFFALYVSLNSFSQVVIKSYQKEGVWKRWPPMTGEKIVI